MQHTSSAKIGTYLFLGFALLVGGLIPFSAVSAANDAQFVTHYPPLDPVCTNTGIPVSVTMKNTGDTTWSKGAGYALGSQNPRDNNIWGGWTGLSRDVTPGDQFEFVRYTTTPSVPGTYNFQYQMVQDGVEWFGPQTPNVAVQVKNCSPVPLPPPLPPAPAPSILCSRIDFSPSSPQTRGTQISVIPYATSTSGISKIELFHNPSSTPGDVGGTSWIPFGTTNSGQGVVWNTSGFAPKTYRIGMKVYDTSGRIDDFNSNGMCQASYQITDVAPALSLLSPNGGEVIQANSPATISWSSFNLDHYTLYYSVDSGRNWTQIAHPVYGTSYQWTTPVLSQNDIFSQSDISTLRVRVVGETAQHQAQLQDDSNADFTLRNIQSAPTVTASHTPQNPGTTAQVTISASAFDSDGIRTMRIYVDNMEVRQCLQAFCSTFANTYPAGTHTYHATAEDSRGNTGASAMQTFVVQGFSGIMPIVAVSHSPFAPTTNDYVSIAASVSAQYAVQSISIYVDGSLRNTCSNTTLCSVSATQYGTGTHTYYAQARDSQNNTGNSATQSFTVNGGSIIPVFQTTPSVSVSHNPLSPLASDFVIISANASDADGIQSITIYVDGGVKQTCPNASSCQTTSQQYASGLHSYYATATDFRGTQGNSQTQNFTVAGIQQPSNTNPSITMFHSPISPTTNDYVIVTANASDPDGIQSISIFVDGSLYSTCLGTAFCQTPSQQFSLGTHTYYATATDSRQSTGTASPQTFNVSNFNQPQQATIPTVNVSHFPFSPTGNDLVTVTANASDIDGIQSISVYIDGSFIQTCTQISSCPTSGRQFSPGTHNYYATATDTRGNIGNSTTQSFTVSGGSVFPPFQSMPTVSASHNPLSPSPNDYVAITATASDIDGIQNISIYVDGNQRITCQNTISCQLPSQQYTPGSHSYYAQAQDSRGTIGVSITQSFTVQNTTTGTLAGEFSAFPSSGFAPLIGVSLSATVSGTMQGTITYRFDCTGDGVWEQAISTSSSSYTATGLCSYFNPGIYVAKISAERNGITSQGSVGISVR
ncbi:MAG: Ig-like domain-containing protein [bacterium]|nr:Ig-like domain-containing protein [bacterium]